jgi:medium-chain acyl-[acyl-carrier-protein] hydrolase
MKKKEFKPVYEVPFRVRSYEVDSNERAGISAVCNYFQEAAGVHANHLNFDISQLQENGNTWVLYKMHVRLEAFPRRWEKITVITRPSSGDGIRAFRDYELLNEKGERIAAAVSQWMVLNEKTRRPVRMPKEVMEMGLKNPGHIIEPVKTPVKGADPVGAQIITTVGRHDLDMNNHVNNVRYIDWVTGYMPSSKIGERNCVEVEIQYVSEAVKGEKIYHAFEQASDGNGLTFRHSLFSGDEKKLIATAFSKWG